MTSIWWANRRRWQRLTLSIPLDDWIDIMGEAFFAPPGRRRLLLNAWFEAVPPRRRPVQVTSTFNIQNVHHLPINPRTLYRDRHSRGWVRVWRDYTIGAYTPYDIIERNIWGEAQEVT